MAVIYKNSEQKMSYNFIICKPYVNNHSSLQNVFKLIIQVNLKTSMIN